VWRTPVGNEFRELLDKWDAVCIQEKRDNHIRLLVDGQNFVFYFKFEGDIYATHEPQRVTFARMKNPSDDDDIDLGFEQAHFKAFNLTKALSGKMASPDIFYKDDIDRVEIVDRDEALGTLTDQAKNIEPDRIAIGAKAIMAALSKAQPDEPREPGVPLNQDEWTKSYIDSLRNKLGMRAQLGTEEIADMSVEELADILAKVLPDIPDHKRNQFAAGIRQAATLDLAP